MFPPIRKDRNRKIQILFTVEGRYAAGTAELLSVILSSEESGVIGQNELVFNPKDKLDTN